MSCAVLFIYPSTLSTLSVFFLLLFNMIYCSKKLRLIKLQLPAKIACYSTIVFLLHQIKIYVFLKLKSTFSLNMRRNSCTVHQSMRVYGSFSMFFSSETVNSKRKHTTGRKKELKRIYYYYYIVIQFLASIVRKIHQDSLFPQKANAFEFNGTDISTDNNLQHQTHI